MEMKGIKFMNLRWKKGSIKRKARKRDGKNSKNSAGTRMKRLFMSTSHCSLLLFS